MSVDDLAGDADELWARLLQAMRADRLGERLADELLNSAAATLDTQSLKMFEVLMIYGLVDAEAFHAAEAIAGQISTDSRTDAERIIADARAESGRARETSRRAEAQQVLMDLRNVPGVGLEDNLVAFRQIRERSGDIVTDAEMSALRVHFPTTAAARDARIPSAADLYSALQDIRRGARDGSAY